MNMHSLQHPHEKKKHERLHKERKVTNREKKK